MKSQILIVLALMPGLIAAPAGQLPESVSKLLHKPRLGPASLTLSDGTRSDGAIVRVTDQFVTFEPTPFAPGACVNIELSRIAKINWREKPTPVHDAILDALMVITLAPAILDGGLAKTDPKDPMLGSWESPEGPISGRIRTNRVEFTRNGSAPENTGYVEQMDILVQEGKYRVDGGTLHLSQVGNAPEAVVDIRFECDVLVASNSTRVRRLRSTGIPLHGASAPIVGGWNESSEGERTTWQFRPDGGFTITSIDRRRHGQFAITNNRMKVAFGAAGSEEWDVRRKSGRLFISIGGNVTEYQKGPAVR
jgi:hypothetical protein